MAIPEFTQSIGMEEFLSIATEGTDEWVQVSSPLAGGFPLDFLAKFRKEGAPTICFLPAAQPRENRRERIYNRWKWTEALSDFNVLVLSEPPLYADESVLAGWLMHPKVDLVREVSKQIGRVLQAWGVSNDWLLMYGSSMGGFEALNIATAIPGSHCIAEVPQLDMYNYQFPEALESIEKHVLGSSIIRHRRLHPEQFSVLSRIEYEQNVPNALVITNRGDYEFLEVLKLMSEAETGSEASGLLSMYVWPEPIGHRPLRQNQAIPFIYSWKSRMETQTSGSLKKKRPNEPTQKVGLFDLKHPRTVKLAETMTFPELRAAAMKLSESVEMTRDNEDRERYEEAIHHLLAASIVNEKQDWSILRACSLVKRWELSFGGELLGLAEEAFRRKQSQGALSYICRGILADFDYSEINRRFRELREKLVDPGLLAILGIFESIAIYDKGDLGGYEEKVRETRSLIPPDFQNYILTPFSTVVLDEDLATPRSNDTCTELVQELDRFREGWTPTEVDYTIVTSCDAVYLDAFGELLVKSFEISTSAAARLVIVVLGTRASVEEQVLRLQAFSPRVEFVFFELELEENLAPGSSLVRFFPVSEILSTSSKPVILMDIDAVITDDLTAFVDAGNGSDLALRRLGQKVAPWERYAAGIVVFYPTEVGKYIAEKVKFAGVRILRPGDKQWWIDQSMLEYGIRSAEKKFGKPPKMENLMSITRTALVLPTGRRETKLKVLRAALEKVEAPKNG